VSQNRNANHTTPFPSHEDVGLGLLAGGGEDYNGEPMKGEACKVHRQAFRKFVANLHTSLSQIDLFTSAWVSSIRIAPWSGNANTVHTPARRPDGVR